MDIDELADLIRAGLDADEALALEAPGRRWHIGNAVDPTQPCNVHTFPEAREVADGLNWLVAEHIARHNPQRVLAEVAGKRKLIALLFRDKHGPDCVSSVDDWCDCGRDVRVLAILNHLAQPYQETT